MCLSLCVYLFVCFSRVSENFNSVIYHNLYVIYHHFYVIYHNFYVHFNSRHSWLQEEKKEVLVRPFYYGILET